MSRPSWWRRWLRLSLGRSPTAWAAARRLPTLFQPWLETLEERCQPAVTINEFSLTAGSFPVYITAGPDGNLWFTEGGAIARITPQGTVTEFSIPGGANARRITAGPDGNLWFSEPGADRIGRITPQGTITEFSIGISPGAEPDAITAGPDGNLWFTEFNLSRIGQITPQGVVTEFSIGISPGGGTDGITAGPDGNLWFTEYNLSLIGQITPQGTVTEFNTNITSGAGPDNITAGPDGNLWFTEGGGAGIGRITPQGVITEFTTGFSSHDSRPDGITAGPDGNLWFTEYADSRIGQVTPQGVITEFSTGISPNSSPDGITLGPDGALWFAENTGIRIGHAVISDGPQLGALAPTAWTVGLAYTGTVTVTGAGPFSNLTQSGLPAGLSASLSGSTITISGTPTTPGTFVSVQLGVTDANNNTGSNTYSLTINPAVALTAPPLPQGTVGAAYNQTITASGGTGNTTLTYSVSAGSVPNGLSITPASPATTTITLSGTPTTAGSFTLHVSATDTLNAPPAIQDYVVTVADAGLPPEFVYDQTNRTLTITLSAAFPNFQFTQKTTANGTAISTIYTFALSDNSSPQQTEVQSFPDTALTTSPPPQTATVTVIGRPSGSTAVLITNDTYVAAGGAPQETPETIALGAASNAGAGSVAKLDTGGIAYQFLTLSNCPVSYAYAGRGDGTVSLFGTAGAPYNGFVSAGNYAYIGAPGLFHLAQGAASVYGYSAGQAADFAFHYSANPGSSYVVSGVAFSYMSATDTANGATQPFFNVGVGFRQNTGVSHNPGKDYAYIIDSRGNDTFVGGTAYSFMYSSDPAGIFTEFDAAFAFALVYGQSFVGGFDSAFNTDANKNILVGFHVP